jgi:hypothetical protein
MWKTDRTISLFNSGPCGHQGFEFMWCQCLFNIENNYLEQSSLGQHLCTPTNRHESLVKLAVLQ